GGGSSELKPKKEYSPLEGLEARFPNATILHTLGYASGPPAYGRVLPSGLNADSLQAKALEIAAQADVVLFVGGLNKNHHQDCEGGDRLQYALPFGQPELIEALAGVNPNLGVVLVSGNAVETRWLPRVKGLMQAWYLGSEAGHILADVISGDVNPSGKLPFSFPVKLEDNAAHAFGPLSYPGDSIKQVYEEDILVGYRWHDTKGIAPQFAFGYGLSYTRFALSELSVAPQNLAAGDTIYVQGQVRNSGPVAGAEVVQVYVGKPQSRVTRAQKELRAFAKVSLAAGETKPVSLAIPVADLAYYDEAAANWRLEPGRYTLYIGTASNLIREEIAIKIQDE
ncbi:MAG: glycosyl hydrolase, partial [Bacteroidetes bacterium]